MRTRNEQGAIELLDSEGEVLAVLEPDGLLFDGHHTLVVNPSVRERIISMIHQTKSRERRAWAASLGAL